MNKVLDHPAIGLPKLPGVNPQTFSYARTLEPDLRRAIGSARGLLESHVRSQIRSFPRHVRWFVPLLWWPITKLVAPMIMELTIEMIDYRRGVRPKEECCECVQDMADGKGIDAWHQSR